MIRLCDGWGRNMVFKKATSMTYNELIDKIAKRAGELASEPIDHLRSQYPETTDTQAELIRYCKESGFSKADLVRGILYDEFDVEFDYELQEPV